MHVADIQLCKELYKLSGWVPEANMSGVWPRGSTTMHGHRILLDSGDIPAYDLGYLLRKLPLKLKDEYQGDLFGVRMKQTNGSGWVIWYGEIGKDTEMYFNSANTPEDAACKLLCELIKQGVLKP